MKVKEVQIPGFKETLQDCLDHGDISKDVKNMELSELIPFLREKLREDRKIVREWLKQNE